MSSDVNVNDPGPGSRRSQRRRACSRPFTFTFAFTFTTLIVGSLGIAKADPCTDPDVTKRLAALVHARRFADAHHAATDLRVQCGNQDTWRELDDIALIRL